MKSPARTKRMTGAVLFLALAFAWGMAGTVFGEEMTTVTGMVIAEYDDAYENVVSARISLADETSLDIVMDALGSQMAQEMDYSDVQVVGQTIDEDGKKMLKVASWKSSESDKEASKAVDEQDGSVAEVSESDLEVYEPVEDMDESIVEVYESVEDMDESIVEVYESVEDMDESVVEIYEPVEDVDESAEEVDYSDEDVRGEDE